jgi:hypothetical protein
MERSPHCDTSEDSCSEECSRRQAFEWFFFMARPTVFGPRRFRKRDEFFALTYRARQELVFLRQDQNLWKFWANLLLDPNLRGYVRRKVRMQSRISNLVRRR